MTCSIDRARAALLAMALSAFVLGTPDDAQATHFAPCTLFNVKTSSFPPVVNGSLPVGEGSRSRDLRLQREAGERARTKARGTCGRGYGHELGHANPPATVSFETPQSGCSPCT